VTESTLDAFLALQGPAANDNTPPPRGCPECCGIGDRYYGPGDDDYGTCSLCGGLGILQGERHAADQ
jgi:hypothetical protein